MTTATPKPTALSAREIAERFTSHDDDCWHDNVEVGHPCSCERLERVTDLTTAIEEHGKKCNAQGSIDTCVWLERYASIVGERSTEVAADCLRRIISGQKVGVHDLMEPTGSVFPKIPPPIPLPCPQCGFAPAITIRVLMADIGACQDPRAPFVHVDIVCRQTQHEGKLWLSTKAQHCEGKNTLDCINKVITDWNLYAEHAARAEKERLSK